MPQYGLPVVASSQTLKLVYHTRAVLSRGRIKMRKGKYPQPGQQGYFHIEATIVVNGKDVAKPRNRKTRSRVNAVIRQVLEMEDQRFIDLLKRS